jgi:hypothetical protein
MSCFFICAIRSAVSSLTASRTAYAARNHVHK